VSEPRFDVIIVGGGPAGSAAARSLALQERTVALVERSNYEQVRVGETLPAAIRIPLTQLGLWNEFAAAGHVPSYAVRCAWESPTAQDNDSLWNPHGNGWHVDRARFDAMLAGAAGAAGAIVFRATRAISFFSEPAGDWRIQISGEAGRSTLRAGMLVDASGRRALVARRLGAATRVADRLVGVVAMLPAGCTAPWTLIEAVENGWWYSAPLPDSRMVVALMSDADLWAGESGWLAGLRAAPLTQQRCGELKDCPKLQIVSASSVLRQPLTGAGWIAVGDAAMAFDPLSGQGVFQGLESGIRAARTIGRWLDGDGSGMDEYAVRARADFERYLEVRKYFYGSVRRWPGSTFWQRRRAVAES